MRKAMLLSAAITLCAALALAQDTPSAGASSQTGSTTSSTSRTTTDQNTAGNAIQGCLTGTSGNYTLTDATGVSYKVQGDDSQLSANVNKQVEVMGTVGSSASASTSNNADTNAPNGASQGSSNQGDANANAGSSTAGSTGATATATASKTLDVTSVKMVADSCSNSK
jgi:hypothetical protein